MLCHERIVNFYHISAISEQEAKVGTVLLPQILHRTEVLIAPPDIPVGQIQIRFLSDCHAAMAQDVAQGVDVHSGHDAALGKVVSQCMRGYLFLDACSCHVFFEVRFKAMYL